MAVLLHEEHPLVVVGSAPYSAEYTRRIHELAEGDARVRLLGGVWDQELLDQLYANAFTYLHGHSVGGTNPSLLRAIGGGTATIAYDVAFNREVLRDAGRYFTTPVDLAEQVLTAEANPEDTRSRGDNLARRSKDYDWDVVVDGYERLARDLVARNTPGPRPFARRRRRRAFRA
jgi:glycosyltransferase involved in cell wall biosynthesis